jgi:ankyrin repeat protein
MWAYCQLEVLKKIRSSREVNINVALQGLPITLHGTYERMLMRVLETDCEEAVCLLRWLTCASRPLTLGELQETRRLVDFDRNEDVAWNDPGSIEDIAEILGDLIHISPIYDHYCDVSKWTTNLPVVAAQSEDTQSRLSDCRVQLAHSSVRDYLFSDRVSHPSTSGLPLQSSATHLFLARSCLTYFKRYTHSIDKTSTKGDNGKFPLLHYAANCWSDHMIDDVNDRKTRYLNLLRGNPFQSDDNSKHQLLRASPTTDTRSSANARAGSALYHASRLGCASSVRILIEHGAYINVHEGPDCIALAAALHGRFTNIFSVLLGAGARLEPACGLWNALKWAVYHGFSDETRLLMHAYHTENSRLRDFPKALDIAAARGHLDIVKMLIASGTSVTSTIRSKSAKCINGNPDVNPMQGTKLGIRLALEGAVLRSHSAIVEALIDAGARVSDEILALAASKSDMATIRTLLRVGTDTNADRASAKSTALYKAAESGRYGAARALIESGADIHSEGELLCTPLRAACYGGHREVVELLLKNGVSPNADLNGTRKGTALEAASMCGHCEIVRTLVAAKAVVDAPGIFGTTALQTALHQGHEQVADILIDAGANMNAVDGNCNAMLCAAVHGGLADYVRKFLDAGADINLRVLGVPLLHFAASEGYFDIVALLLTMSIDVNILDQHHGTALHAACSGRHASTVELLILKGADTNATVHRRTPLQIAYSLGHQFIATLLLAAGANTTLRSAPVVHQRQPRVIRRSSPRPVQPRAVD